MYEVTQMETIPPSEMQQIDQQIAQLKASSVTGSNPTPKGKLSWGQRFGNYLSGRLKAANDFIDDINKGIGSAHTEAERLNRHIPAIRSFGEQLKVLGTVAAAVSDKKTGAEIYKAGERLSTVENPVPTKAEILLKGAANVSDSFEMVEEEKRRKEEARKAAAARARNRKGGTNFTER